jgi:predicted heme/steroid binding protein
VVKATRVSWTDGKINSHYKEKSGINISESMSNKATANVNLFDNNPVEPKK